MNHITTYKEIYNKEPEHIGFCPYRISPLGAHIDHQYGHVNGMALDKGIYFAYHAKRSGICELNSLQFKGIRAQFHVNNVPQTKENDWADYLRGAALMLSKKYDLKYGLGGVFDGSLPIGGLSSSAAVTIVFLNALCKVNNIVLNEWELISIAQAAEREYVGVNCGTLDQSCEVLCKKDHLLYLDTSNNTYELVKKNIKMKPFKIAIFFSGLERSLANSAYNSRQDECKSAAYYLMAKSFQEYGSFKDARLRNVSRDIFDEYKEGLPLNWKKRAIHYYTEDERATKGVQAWRSGDIEEYGRLMFESGKSSIENYESGCPELKKIHEIMTHTKGIYGGRFSGAGFKGCCLAFIDPEYEESILKQIEEEYLETFPELKGKYKAFICESADGVIESNKKED